MPKTSRSPFISEVRKGLVANANPERARGAQAYMKSEMPYRGLDSKTLRKIERDGWKRYPIKDATELEAIVLEFWDNAEYREERYVAQETLTKYQKYLTMDHVPLIRHLIVTGAWWDHVDGIAKFNVGGLLAAYPKPMTAELKRWIKDDHLWIRRAAVLSQLAFKDKTDTELLFSFCSQCLEETTFWMRKAIGWALREYSKTDPVAVREFIEKNRDRMSGLTYREASKYV